MDLKLLNIYFLLIDNGNIHVNFQRIKLYFIINFNFVFYFINHFSLLSFLTNKLISTNPLLFIIVLKQPVKIFNFNIINMHKI